MEYINYYDSPLGAILLSSDDNALTGLWFEGQRYYAKSLSDEHQERKTPVMELASKWLDIYFSGNEPDFTVPVAVNGTPFQKEVCRIMQTIPYGNTMTYGEIADIITAERNGSRTSPRAVGSAVGHNPVSIIIPCHRVVGSDGSLTGYAGGLERKQKLLMLEHAAI